MNQDLDEKLERTQAIEQAAGIKGNMNFSLVPNNVSKFLLN